MALSRDAMLAARRQPVALLLLLLHRQQLLHLALQELPPNCREALLLNRLHGLNHAAIAEQRGAGNAGQVAKERPQGLEHTRALAQERVHHDLPGHASRRTRAPFHLRRRP